MPLFESKPIKQLNTLSEQDYLLPLEASLMLERIDSLLALSEENRDRTSELIKKTSILRYKLHSAMTQLKQDN